MLCLSPLTRLLSRANDMFEGLRIYLDGKIVDVDAALNFNGIHSVYSWSLFALPSTAATPLLAELT